MLWRNNHLAEEGSARGWFHPPRFCAHSGPIMSKICPAVFRHGSRVGHVSQMPENLEAKVLEWLRTQGYPFELQVARRFRRLEWEVDHARAYRDVKTKETRQIDVAASLHRSVKPDEIGATLTVVVECKKSAKPWVIFSAPRNPEYPSFDAESLADPLSRDLMWQLMARFSDNSQLLSPRGILGHGAVRAEFTTTNTDDSYKPYVALQEVLSAARGLGEENQQGFAPDGFFQPTLDIVIPIIVLDAALFSFELTNDGNENLARIEFAKVLVPSATDYGTAVPVMTLHGLERVLAADTPVFIEMCQ